MTCCDNNTIISLIDLTSLNYSDSNIAIKHLCQKIFSSKVKVAAICVYPQYISIAKKLLKESNVNIATVVNFPLGGDPLDKVVSDVKMALQYGATEIDLVIPYQDYIKYGGSKNAELLIRACKKICGKYILKVIIESGILKKPTLIQKATEDAIMAGADFIKTSTGKMSAGATIEAARLILDIISKNKSNNVGFKASGGIKTLVDAEEYIQLATQICGSSFINNKTFRFGASGLFDTILSLGK
jgi:deoxyribose-phosphate aldolase